jgi:hypothetical protein
MTENVSNQGIQIILKKMALLKSSRQIEHPLIFKEITDRKNDTF